MSDLAESSNVDTVSEINEEQPKAGEVKEDVLRGLINGDKDIYLIVVDPKSGREYQDDEVIVEDAAVIVCRK